MNKLRRFGEMFFRYAVLSGFALCLLCFSVRESLAAKAATGGELHAWPLSIDIRACPGSFCRDCQSRTIGLEALAGEVVSAQVAVKSGLALKGLRGVLTELRCPDGSVIGRETIRIRYGRLIPVVETRTMTYDPLIEAEEGVDVPANVAQPVWLTIELPRSCGPGMYEGELSIMDKSGQAAIFAISLEVLPATLPAPEDWEFYLNIWQSPSGIARAHGVESWSEEHWALIEKYAGNFAAHGQDAITTAVVHAPWGSVVGYLFESMVQWSYPGARYKPGSAEMFSWDFAVFDRYVETLMAAGIDRKIDCFSLVQGPGKNHNSVFRYLDTTSGEYRLVTTAPGQQPWREIWSVFLAAFREHLLQKGWFDIAYLAFDEKPEEEMRTIYNFLAGVAPEYKVDIAGGYPGSGEKITDALSLYIPNMKIGAQWQKQEQLIRFMREQGGIVTFYTACEPLTPNTHLYSQLRESRVMPWLARKYGLDGYLRWAVCTYPDSVWTRPRQTWPSGDMFLVYPGEHGPLDSMRWELLRQGIQDYETYSIALRLASKAGREDLLEQLSIALARGAIIEDCRPFPLIGSARAMVNAVIRQLGGQSGS